MQKGVKFLFLFLALVHMDSLLDVVTMSITARSPVKARLRMDGMLLRANDLGRQGCCVTLLNSSRSMSSYG